MRRRPEGMSRMGIEVERGRVGHGLEMVRRHKPVSTVKPAPATRHPRRYTHTERTHPVVPNGNGVGLPVEAYLEVRVLADLVEKQVQDGV